ncbi:hypothetical protein D1872_36010 [compost metagenome]
MEQKRGTNQYYLTFKRVKIRYRADGNMDYFNHPFQEGNKIQLLDDVHLETSLSEEAIGSDFEGIPDLPAAKGITGSNAIEEDIFDFGSAINKKAS